MRTSASPWPANNSAVPYRWCAGGDVNAFFGLAVDNMTNLVVLTGLLVRRRWRRFWPGLAAASSRTRRTSVTPAYKAMGARATYTLATGLLIGLGAISGIISLVVGIVPEAAVAPILIFVGLEITAQAFLATPARHAPAVALAFLPVIAALLLIEINGVLTGLGQRPSDLTGEAARTLEIVRVLGNGFILSALLWGSGVALIVDRRLLGAASVFAVASVASVCGVIHSPLETGGLFWPWGSSPDGRDC